ncbi:thiotemplate mechanism natural product synthetase [Leptodontidium sp. MPI-SDFR-AT-0119]|nr:thiotemplate mechanism natural product synthetase [Leptodontidium sp. MPI-SDFR-AT-0119]
MSRSKTRRNLAKLTQSSGRPEGFEDAVGQFANPLPVRIPLAEHFRADSGSEKATFASFVTSVSRNVSKVKKAERLSLLDIARRWRTKGRLGHFNSPQVAVSYSLAHSDHRCKLFPVQGSWDLFFVFQEGVDGVELGVIYDPEVFNEKDMDRMKSTYMNLVELASSSSPGFLEELPGLPKYLTIPTAPDPNRFIARIVLSCAETNSEMTYGELDKASTLRAHGRVTDHEYAVLESHGVSAESIVILHLRRGFHMLEWILATLKAGGAYVYLDPSLPSGRKQVMTGIVLGPSSILVTEDLLTHDAEWTNAFKGTIVPHLDTVALNIPYSDLLTKQVDSGSLAYMIFTSGSTGEPKGVMIEHKSFAHFVHSSVPIYQTGHGSRVLQLASFSFDASILEWSSALAAGGTLCFAKSPQALVGNYLADVIEKNDVSFMQITPSALATFPLHRQVRSLRCISVGGEAVPAHLLEIWRERVAVVNSYGPTETGIAVTFAKYANDDLPIEKVSASQPPKGTEVYICDSSFQRILPRGMEGEICIGGKSLGRGYCARSEPTHAAFAIHPTLGTRLYRSGDRGTLQLDSNLVVQGRMDREVKIRGYRIAPEEIEVGILATDAAVGGASVQVSPDGLTLIAVIAPETCSTKTVLRELGKILPSHMQPSMILPVSSLPKMSSGKFDHKMQELIGLAHIPSNDVNFFDMGGHSHLVPLFFSTPDLFYHPPSRVRRDFCPGIMEKVNGVHAPLAKHEELPEDRTISIIGISGKFPAAENPDELYDNLSRGVSAIRESTQKMTAPKDCIWVPRAGTLSGIEEFDAKFWKLAREEATDMDPQQRLFLNAALHALNDAGLDTFSDTSNNIGVFVGAAASQYHTLTDPVFGDPFQRANRGFVAPLLSARTAYHLNLHGPNVTINTNCASSNIAITLTVDALRNHRCDLAVVGGVSVQLYDGGYVTQPKSIFSETGRCRPFEEGADGTVPSDAVVAVVLKRTLDAVENEDSSYAEIVGAAYNSDGATNKAGYQVPSPEGQSDVIVAAWKNAGVSPEKLQYIELHGSGTPIGDALELEGIKTSLAKIGLLALDFDDVRSDQ